MQQFNISMTMAVLGLSLPLFGIAFAPIITPHLSERFGRSPVYLVSLPLFALFILGAAYSSSFGALAVCRFFAGFFGGPCLVLIEGTFADVWPAHSTVTYYSFLSLASYIGAGCGESLPCTCRSLSLIWNPSTACFGCCRDSEKLAMDSIRHLDDSLCSVPLRYRGPRNVPPGNLEIASPALRP